MADFFYDFGKFVLKSLLAMIYGFLIARIVFAFAQRFPAGLYRDIYFFISGALTLVPIYFSHLILATREARKQQLEELKKMIDEYEENKKEEE